jgi:hypothetical protein
MKWEKIALPHIGQRIWEVSSEGTFRVVDRRSKVDGHIIKGHQQKKYRTMQGYMVVSIKSKTFRAGRLVATAFIPNPENKPQVNHKNGIKWDDRVENLEWCTAKENIEHSVRTGLLKSKVSKEIAIYIRENYATMGSIHLSKMFNLSRSYVVGIALGKHRKHFGGVRQTKSSWIGDAPKPIIKYDLTGNEIAKYTSASQASKINGVKLARIKEVLTGGRKSYLGSVYKYQNPTDFYFKPRTKRIEKRVKILRFTKEGEPVGSYFSQAEAARDSNINRKGIYNVLVGKQRTAGGYVFKYP